MHSSSRWTINAKKAVSNEIVETADLFDPQNPELGRQPGGHANSGAARMVVAPRDRRDGRGIGKKPVGRGPAAHR